MYEGVVRGVVVEKRKGKKVVNGTGNL